MENYDSLRILFIRHAETNYDDWEGRDPCDGELTPFGEEQCNILGEKLKNEKIDAFISSSLLRAFKTCVGVCKAQGNNPTIEICPEIIECGCTPGYFGCSEGYLNKYTDHTVVFTGGDSFYFAEKLKSSIFVVPNLVLVGLALIADYYAQQKNCN